VTRIDVAGGQLTPAWVTTVDPAGGAARLAYAPDGSRLYVSTPLRKSVLPVSTATGAAGLPIADHLTNWELVIGGSGRYLFATSGGAAVAVISTAAGRLARTIRVPDRLGGFVSLQAAPGGRQVFAVVSADWLVPISAADGRPGRRIPADGQPARIVFGR
jgi:DNA-binding beta-propeller fold protein YncE